MKARGFKMTQTEELTMLRKIVKIVKNVQNHVQFPPRGGQCWCDQCEAIRKYEELKTKRVFSKIKE